MDNNVIANQSTSNYADNFKTNDKQLKASTKNIKANNGKNNNLDYVDFNQITMDSRKNPLVVNDPKKGITYLLKNYGKSP